MSLWQVDSRCFTHSQLPDEKSELLFSATLLQPCDLFMGYLPQIPIASTIQDARPSFARLSLRPGTMWRKAAA